MRCHRATILDSVSCVNLKPMERVEALRAETEPSTGSVYDSLTDGRTQPRMPTFQSLSSIVRRLIRRRGSIRKHLGGIYDS